MIQSGSPPERRKRRWTPWKVFFLAFGILVVLAILLVTFAAIRYSVSARRRIEVQLAAIREAGEPITPAELEEHYRLPPDVEDTTALWMEATALLETPEFFADARDLPVVGTSELGIPPPGQPWQHLEAVERLLYKYHASLELMHQAAEAGGAARYPTDFHQGPLMPLEHAYRLNGGARMLSLEAHVRAHRADPAGAARSIRATLMLGRSLKREPVTISMLVRIAYESIAISDLEDLLGTVRFSDEDLIGLQDDLRVADYGENLYQAMLGERVWLVMAIEDPAAALGDDEPQDAMGWLTRRDAVALAMEHMAELVAAARKPWPQALQDAHQAQWELFQITDASAVNRIRYEAAELKFLPISMVFESVARIEAINEAADAAIGIERFRRKHGKLPEKLDELVPEFLPQVPIDPFDGQPLRYVVDGDGCRVYSVGENGTDEGGEGDLEGDPDIVFRLGAPAEAEEASEQ